MATRRPRNHRPRRKYDPWKVPESAAVTKVGKAKAAIGYLAKKLKSDEFKKKVGIAVSEVFKGGSLGHGTQVQQNYDIDLVLYSETLLKQLDKVVSDGCGEWLDKTTEFLKTHTDGRCSDYDTHKIKINHEEVVVGIKFIYSFHKSKEEISVDLFLSPNFSSLNELLEFLQGLDKKKRMQFSVCASKWQKRFFYRQHQWVKEFTRRMKAWRDIAWDKSEEGRPKSYLLSILVITAFARIPLETQKRKKGGMKRLVPVMTEKLKELVCEIADRSDLDLIVPESNLEVRMKYKDLIPDCPRIIDPVNPANNLYLSGVKGGDRKNKWAAFKENVADLNLGPEIMEEHKALYTKNE